ncbi:MAG: putative secreted protein [Pseudonocardiales bacterium]|jgi:hypothetical protein|nr:putative secreted protein [Pseudonocardiales bacterium]
MHKWLLATAIAGTVWTMTMAAAGADTDVSSVTRAGSWVLANSTTVASAAGNQGLTTVTRAGRAVTVTRGYGSIVPDLAAQGWNHVGDPSSVGGSVLDAYQTDRPIGAKLFTLTTAAGVRSDYLHRLVPGEMSNNSFAAVAPGGQWFVSGEWRTMTRLLVFATPDTNARLPGIEQSLPLATTIALTHPVRNVQGCAFSSATSMICSTNDSGTDLYPVPRQLLVVQLARPLDGRPVIGTPRLLGEVPSQTLCAGPAGEVEGIDVHGNRMVVAVNTYCGPTSQLFTYTAPVPGRAVVPRAASRTSSYLAQAAHGENTAEVETMRRTT